VLRGNTHPLARAEFDAGLAPRSQPMSRMMLVLRRSDAQQAALEQLLAAQQDPSSPQFHQWLTPASFGTRFGPSDQDVATVTDWLRSQGFSDIHLDNGRRIVEFSGTAGQVAAAFSTSIHHYNVNGSVYSANAADPQIPQALSPVVAGIVTLHNFPRQRHSRIAGTFTRTASGSIERLAASPSRQSSSRGVTPQSTTSYNGQTFYAVSPYDFATIYNVLPLWTASSPIDGAGQVIAIVGQTDINPQDFVGFRNLFSLPLGNTGTPTGTQYLNILHNGDAPGINGDETEADLDTQWSSAVAKAATIDFVVSASTETAAGVDLSAEYIIDNNLAPVMSTSYGECELGLGSSGNAFYNSLYQQAAAQGITVMTSSGDSSAAGCDPSDFPEASYGLAVSGLNSTPYNVSVGGTDFYMPGNGSTYWNATNNSTTNASAKSYIPELAWNDGCANSVLGSLSTFSGRTPEQVCNDSAFWYAPYNLLAIAGGGGGKSSCTHSDGATPSSCSTPYPKPTWQAGPGVPADGVRDVPDVSLFAANGEFGSFYVVCEQDQTDSPCGLNSSPTSPVTFDFIGIGGTSASSPAFAGIMALVNQKTGSRQGNANYVLYKLAAQQSATSCNSATGSGSSCIFNDVTLGSNVVPCLLTSPNCTSTNPGDYVGILSGNPSTTGYDLATGLGSVNVANLVHGWNNVGRTSSSTGLELTPLSAIHGSALTATVSVSSNAGTPTGLVSVNGNAPNGSQSSGALTDGQWTQTLNSLPGGNYAVTAHYAGDATFAASDSSPITVSISAEPSVETLQAKVVDPVTGIIATVSTAPYGSYFLIRGNVAGKSGYGIPTGSISITDNGAPFDSGAYPLSSDGSAEDSTVTFNTGTHTLAEGYSGDASFSPGTGSQSLIVTPMPMTCTYQANTTVLRPGWGLNLGIFAKAKPAHSTDFFYIPSGSTPAPTGTLSIYEGATLIGGPYPPSGSSGGAILPCYTGGCYDVPTLYTQQNVDAPQILEPLQPVTVVYSGDANHAACTSTPLILTDQTGPVASYLNTYFTNLQYPFPQDSTANVTVYVTPQTPAPAFEPPYPNATGTIQALVDGTAAGSPVTVSAQGSTAISVPASGLAVGDHTLSFSYSGDATYLPSTGGNYNITVAGPDFSLSPTSTSATIQSGSTTPAQSIQVVPSSGFTGAVTFSCSGLPRDASCVFSPSSVAPGNATSLTISTVQASVIHAPSQAALTPAARPHRVGARTTLLAIGVLLFLPFATRKRPRALLALTAFLILPLLSSCGGATAPSGGGGNGSGPPPPLGTSSVNLAATPLSPLENSSVTFTAGITGYGTSVPATGSVTFYLDGSTTGTSAPVQSAASGTVAATYTTSFATAGTHTVTANYSGDSTLEPGSSGIFNVIVGYANGTPPGSYSVTVTGTSGSLSHSIPLYLTVQ
jgi:hypothetical protein